MARVPPKRNGYSTPGLFGGGGDLYALTEAGKSFTLSSHRCSTYVNGYCKQLKLDKILEVSFLRWKEK